MTQYPECYLARELEMCYVNISLITDYDVGLEGMAAGLASRSHRRSSIATTSGCATRSARSIEKIPVDADCSCRHALEGARV